MDVLIEVHDEAELERALRLKLRSADRHQQPQPEDLRDDACDQRALAPLIPAGRDGRRERHLRARRSGAARAAGISTFLVGESLMRQSRRRRGDARAAGAQRALALPPGERRGARQKTHPSRRHAAKPAWWTFRQNPRPNARPSPRAACDEPATLAWCARATPKRATCSAPRASPASWRPSAPRIDPAVSSARISQVESTLRPTPSCPASWSRARVKGRRPTGVEMEALTAVAVACLTIYDMVKAVERGMRIEGIASSKSAAAAAAIIARGVKPWRCFRSPTRSKRVLANTRAPLPAEEAPLAEADGRVLAYPLKARRTQPPADVSAMDGYAVRAADVANAPVRLKVVGEVAAGRPFRARSVPAKRRAFSPAA
jgi:hypothetical protein